MQVWLTQNGFVPPQAVLSQQLPAKQEPPQHTCPFGQRLLPEHASQT
jgi:hypothetical protein